MVNHRPQLPGGSVLLQAGGEGRNRGLLGPGSALRDGRKHWGGRTSQTRRERTILEERLRKRS